MDSAEPSLPSAAPVALFKKRTTKAKSNFRKRAVTPPANSDDSSSDSSSEDESGQRVKRRKKNTGTVIASSNGNRATNPDVAPMSYTAERSTTIPDSNDATKQSNWYDDVVPANRSAGDQSGKLVAMPSDAPDGTYKGLAKATNFIQKNPNAPTRVVGPVKAPTNVRTITVTDFAPDVCKDYKTTGFCGFGDNCKYLHAREDYKAGWQLDKEWENVTKGKNISGGTKMASANRNAEENDSEDDEAMLEKIPFACIICRERYKDPVVTKCGHYFCEKCALQRYRKDPSCAACGAGTGGVFNVAKGLKKLLERKKERAAKRRQKAIEAGEEVSEEEEEDEE